jgi:phage terminase large subunit
VANVLLPNEWRPRRHQRRLWEYLGGGGKRAVAVWHRRAGKDSTAINWTAVAAHQRIGTYWHMLPTETQGRRVIWDGVDGSGRRLIDQAFPRELRAATRHIRMTLELNCGSVWQVVGSDNYDRLVGANPVGVVFSEWSLTDPRAWDYVRPILAENGGWAAFIYTPRGKNHGFDLYDLARHHGDWFAEKLTVEDTGILTPQVIAGERSSGMSEALIQQEYFCSFEAASDGSYYGKLLEQAD